MSVTPAATPTDLALPAQFRHRFSDTEWKALHRWVQRAHQSAPLRNSDSFAAFVAFLQDATTPTARSNPTAFKELLATLDWPADVTEQLTDYYTFSTRMLRHLNALSSQTPLTDRH